MNKLKLFTVAGCLAFSQSVLAGSLVCSGTVEDIAYHSNNKLMVRLSSMNYGVFICDLSTDWVITGAEGRITAPETCQSILSMLLTARSTNQQINRLHLDGDTVPETCGEFTPWSSVFLRYLHF